MSVGSLEQSLLNIDWLGFTFKVPDVLPVGKTPLDCFYNEYPEFLSISDEFEVLSGHSYMSFAFDCVLKWNDDFIISTNYVDLKPGDLSVNVQVPSHSLEKLFRLFDLDPHGSDSIMKLMQLFYNRHTSLSRIDLCYDDYDKKFDAYYYIRAWINTVNVLRHPEQPVQGVRMRTKFRKAEIVSSINGRSDTFYLGTRKQRTRLLRIYDKDAESDGEFDCVRYEFELHRDEAKAMQLYLMEHDGLAFYEYLSSWFQIVEFSQNKSNISEVGLDGEWSSFFSDKLRFNAKIDVSPKNLKKEVNDITKWLVNYCVPSIKGFCQIFGANYLDKLLRESNVSPRYEAFIRSNASVLSGISNKCPDFHYLLSDPFHPDTKEYKEASKRAVDFYKSNIPLHKWDDFKDDSPGGS